MMRKRRKIFACVTIVVMLSALSVPVFGDELLVENNINSGYIKAGVASVIDDILLDNSLSQNVVEDITISEKSVVSDMDTIDRDVVNDISMNDVLKLAMIAEDRVTITDAEKQELDLTGDHDITMADVVKASIVASRVK